MFTHKATGAWDALTKGLSEAGFVITASWPLKRGRPRKKPEEGRRRQQVALLEGEWDPYAATPEATLDKLLREGYRQAMVFTQYTDTMDFLHEELLKISGPKLMCFSGRGGEVPSTDGSWRRVERDDAKRRFRDGEADVLLCTDAAAEGLNFQFCGALINYDMPWNPMRVEQRIGRIDRLGQRNGTIRIVNLHYEDTVEADMRPLGIGNTAC